MPQVDNYRFLAPFYDWLAGFILGEAFKRSQYLFLYTINKGDRILILGGGTGKNLKEILKRTGESGELCFVEASPSMLAKAKKRVKWEGEPRIQFLCTSDFKAIPNKKFDLVITQYFLDVLRDAELERLFEAIGQRSGPGTRWLFVDFFSKRSKLGLIKLMLLSFRYLASHPRKDFPDYRVFFEKYGWELKEVCQLQNGFIQGREYQKNVF
jgi:ubiquinone/menaquinone biosynthesis C-methylase UbiE